MRKQLLMLALAAVSLASCKKDKIDNNSDPGGTDPDPVPTTKLLKKVTQTTNGNSTVYNFLYNGNKQLTSVKTADNSDVTNFTYDDDGNVTKVESRDEIFHNIYEYVYENGVPVRGTFKSYLLENGAETLSEDDVIHYTVEEGRVTKINMDMNMQQQEMNFILTYNSSGNVTKIQTDGSDVYTAEFTYGTKKPVFPKVFKFVLDQAGYAVQFFAKNELLSMHFDFPGTNNDSSDSMTYTYDPNGYVLTSNDGTTQMAFEY
jgi:YD repeat-containing protein